MESASKTMKNIFNSVPVFKPKSNYFDLTHDVKMSGKIGELMPCLALECVPGDKIKLGSDLMARLAPMYAPIMHRMDITVHYFFSPNRIVWPNWENFITGASNTLGGADPVWPHFLIEGNEQPEFQKLAEYLGVPKAPVGATPTQISALPFAHFMKIFAEYYRDQNLDPLVANEPYSGTVLVDGLNDKLLYGMRNRAWEHDYFTAALPWAQKGAEVVIPFNQSDIPVRFNAAPGSNTVLTGTTASPNVGSDNANIGVGPNELFAQPGDPSALDGAPSINDFRRANALQRWLENNARSGSRYIETLKVRFGVNSSDKRLQRPEYITGVKAPIIISEVLNTTGQTGGVPQGSMAGHGVSVSGGNNGSYFCEEHGYIIGIVSVTPKPAYQQGIPKHYLKNNSLDYLNPEFAHLGEQPIQVQELYAYTANQYETFGYIPRFAEYKYQPSRVAGNFVDELDDWHAGRIFGSEPALNNDFIRIKPEDVNRIFNVVDPAIDTVFMHILNKIGAKRPLPKYGIPGL